MTRIISVVSGKGGVGKTTVTANLGTESQHFGLGFQEVSLNHVLNGEAYITQAVTKHSEGVSVLPASILEFNANSDKLRHTLVDFLGDKDYVLIDTAAGIGDEVEAGIEASDEVLLVSEPELPALTNCLGAKKLAEQLERDILGLVLNSVRDEQSEVEHKDIKELIETDIIGKIPDHRHVREGIALSQPVVSYKPKSKPANKIEDLAHRIKGNEPPKRGLQDKVAEKIHDLNLF